jgi:hypothetical protein
MGGIDPYVRVFGLQKGAVNSNVRPGDVKREGPAKSLLAGVIGIEKTQFPGGKIQLEAIVMEAIGAQNPIDSMAPVPSGSSHRSILWHR